MTVSLWGSSVFNSKIFIHKNIKNIKNRKEGKIWLTLINIKIYLHKIKKKKKKHGENK
jgi:hypothetical protein